MHIAYPPPLYMDLTYYNPLLACRSPQYVIILVCVCDGCRISWRSLSTQLGTGEKKKKKANPCAASIRNIMESYANIVHTEERKTKKKETKRDTANVV